MQFRHLFLAAALPLGACGGPPDNFTQSEWDAVQALSPLPALPADPTNKYADSEAAARLGQKLFFDPGYSGPLNVGDDGTNGGLGQVGDPGKVACASCHAPEHHFADHRSKPNNVSLGVNWSRRNSPSLANVAYYEWFTWAGRLDSLWTQGGSALESPDMGGDRCGVAHYLADKYRAEYDAVFDHDLPDVSTLPTACKPKASPSAADGPWEQLSADDKAAVLRIMANVGKAFAAYERRLVSGPAPFDRYVAGEGEAISASAKRGLKVFVGKGFCVQCHATPIFSDNAFHNLGVPQTGFNVLPNDGGRFDDLPKALSNPLNSASVYSDAPEAGQAKQAGLAPVEEDRGAFRTKNLRGVAQSAPYYHNGAIATLADVVEFYDRGGGDANFVGTKSVKLKALGLTAQEKADLVAFLETLSGELPADWGAPQL